MTAVAVPFIETEPGPPRRSRLVTGKDFIDRVPANVPAVWGAGDVVAWAKGEGLMLVGPDGVGKTTVSQQLLLARIGLTSEFLGLPVAPTADRVMLIAADRPKQAARSLRRMVDQEDLHLLEDRLIVWEGPLPFDITTKPSQLVTFVNDQGVDTLFVDSIKDIALDLSKDEVGGRLNLAFQEVIAEGIELCANHHQRKEQNSGGKPKRLADVYGSRWITAGMGSVILLWGEPGDLIVECIHLKQPADVVGPLSLVHDHHAGITTVLEQPTIESLLGQAAGGLSVSDTARLYFGTEGKPSANQVERARRRLEALIAKGIAERRDDPDGLARYFTRDFVA